MFAVGLFFCLLHAVGSQLAAPASVTMVTLNTNYTLSWDWDQSWVQDVTFTAEYIGAFQVKRLKRNRTEWNAVCAGRSGRSCDFSTAPLLYWGDYLFRVRAHANGTHSEWVQLRFKPDNDAQVGPPSRVALSHAGGNIDVHIDDPLDSRNNSMRDFLPKLFFYILFWEGPSLSQSPQVQNRSSKANLVTLSDLKEWTLYCVAVQTRNKNVRKESSFTSPLCIWTEGVTSWWVIVMCFLVSLGSCFLLIFLFYKASRLIKVVFFPSSQLPSHFREYLCDSPGSDLPHLLTMDSESELMCDKVVVCPQPLPEGPPAEVVAAPPSCLDGDSSHDYEQEGSGGSLDSGIYSSDSGGSVSQTSSQQTSSDVFWPGVCKGEDLKRETRDMRPSQRHQPLTWS